MPAPFSIDQFARQLLIEALFYDAEYGALGNVSLIDQEAVRERFLACDPAGYAVCCGAIGRMDLRPALGAITAPTLVPCSQCGQLMRAHHVCKSCGTYRGRQVIEMGDQAEND